MIPAFRFSLFDFAVLGLVEGITEYLPISSTGHLIIASSLLFGDELGDAQVKSAVDAFTVVIQGGAILAVLGMYWPRVVQMLRGVVGRDAAGLRLAVNIFIAFLPAAVLGVLLKGAIDRHLFRPIPVLIALALGGAWMIWLGRRGAQRLRERDAGAEPAARAEVDEVPRLTIDSMTWKHALAIGVMQCIAMWPGTSRSMMTIAGGTMLGLRARDAAEFSFLLGLPTLGGACIYQLASNLKDSRDAGTPNMFDQLGWGPVAVGLIVATVSAAVAVRWLVAFLTRHGLAPFGWYRLGLCAVMGALIAAGVVDFAAAAG